MKKLAIALPVLCLTLSGCYGSNGGGQGERAQAEMRSMCEDALWCKKVKGTWPNSLEELDTFVKDKHIPQNDPWGRPYRISDANGEFVVSSAGPDRNWGTDDDLVFNSKQST